MASSSTIKQSSKPISDEMKALEIRTSESVEYFDIEQIIMFEQQYKGTLISIVNDRAIHSEKPLKYFIDLLEKTDVFYKPDSGFLINLTYIKRFVENDEGYLLMDNDKTVTISREKRETFIQFVKGI